MTTQSAAQEVPEAHKVLVIAEDVAISENLARARLEEERSKPRPVPQHQISGECGDALLQKIADHIPAAASVSDSELSSFRGRWTWTSIS